VKLRKTVPGSMTKERFDDELRHLFLTENRGQAVAFLRKGSVGNAPRLLERLDVEKPQGTEMPAVVKQAILLAILCENRVDTKQNQPSFPMYSSQGWSSLTERRFRGSKAIRAVFGLHFQGRTRQRCLRALRRL